MREYRPYKHQMGVEGPSFWREQQERRRQEAEAQAKAKESQGRDQPKTQEGAPKRQASMWDWMKSSGSGEAPKAPLPPQDAFQRSGYGSTDPSEYLMMPDIWNFVGKLRSAPGYRGEPFVVDVLTPAVKDLNQSAGEISQFFRIPASAFEGLTLDAAWKQVIGPFIESLEVGMSRTKPFAIPGVLRFEVDEEGKLLLVYQDR